MSLRIHNATEKADVEQHEAILENVSSQVYLHFEDCFRELFDLSDHPWAVKCIEKCIAEVRELIGPKAVDKLQKRFLKHLCVQIRIASSLDKEVEADAFEMHDKAGEFVSTVLQDDVAGNISVLGSHGFRATNVTGTRGRFQILVCDDSCVGIVYDVAGCGMVQNEAGGWEFDADIALKSVFFREDSLGRACDDLFSMFRKRFEDEVVDRDAPWKVPK